MSMWWRTTSRFIITRIRIRRLAPAERGSTPSLTLAEPRVSRPRRPIRRPSLRVCGRCLSLRSRLRLILFMGPALTLHLCRCLGRLALSLFRESGRMADIIRLGSGQAAERFRALLGSSSRLEKAPVTIRPWCPCHRGECLFRFRPALYRCRGSMQARESVVDTSVRRAPSFERMRAARRDRRRGRMRLHIQSQERPSLK